MRNWKVFSKIKILDNMKGYLYEAYEWLFPFISRKKTWSQMSIQTNQTRAIKPGLLVIVMSIRWILATSNHHVSVFVLLLQYSLLWEDTCRDVPSCNFCEPNCTLILEFTSEKGTPVMWGHFLSVPSSQGFMYSETCEDKYQNRNLMCTILSLKLSGCFIVLPNLQ